MKIKLITIFFSIFFITFILTGCNNNHNNLKDTKLNITTSVNFYAEIAKNIAKDKATVHSIISNSAINPHDFEPSAKDAKIVSDSNIVIFNGGGYDFWFEKLCDNKKIIKINAANLINLQKGENEHIWYNPKVLENIANELTKILIEKDKNNKNFYEKNKNEYIANLNKITEKINLLKTKSSGKTVLTTEPIFDYAIKSLNLKTTEEIDRLAKDTVNGNDPSPQTIKNIQENIKNKKIDFIVNNVQTTNKTIESIINLSTKYNIPILNVSETQPNDKTYVEWMLYQYNELEKILEGGKGQEPYHTKDAKETSCHNHNH